MSLFFPNYSEKIFLREDAPSKLAPPQRFPHNPHLLRGGRPAEAHLQDAVRVAQQVDVSWPYVLDDPAEGPVRPPGSGVGGLIVPLVSLRHLAFLPVVLTVPQAVQTQPVQEGALTWTQV